MRLEVIFEKEGSYWLIYAPALDVMTQGKTKREACVMLKDAIELLVNRKSKGFTVTIHPSKRGSTFYLSANNQDKLIALLLRRQRQKHGLTLKELAKRLGSRSVNAFARYEQGRACPTIGKLQELITAINPDMDPVLKFAVD